MGRKRGPAGGVGHRNPHGGPAAAEADRPGIPAPGGPAPGGWPQAVLTEGITAGPALVLTESCREGWLTSDGEMALEARFTDFSESKALFHSVDRMKHSDLTHPGPS